MRTASKPEEGGCIACDRNKEKERRAPALAAPSRPTAFHGRRKTVRRARMDDGLWGLTARCCVTGDERRLRR